MPDGRNALSGPGETGGLYYPPDFVLAGARLRGKGEKVVMRNSQVFPYLPTSHIDPAPGEFIRLGQDKHHADLFAAKPLDKHIIVLRGFPAYIKDQNHQAQALPPLKVSLYHPTPPLLYREGDLRISVPGKVNKGECPIDNEEIDKLGSSGCVARPGKISSVHQGIDK